MRQPDLLILGAPRQYIQGPGAIEMLGELARRSGAAALLIVDRDVRKLLGEKWTQGFSSDPIILECAGEITLPVIEQLVATARESIDEVSTPLLVYGIGGGKALDTAKGVARRLEAEFVAVPTIASNDSPIGRAIAVYDHAHKLISVEHLQRSPEAVVVDTALIAQAPARFLRAGIGDAISKKFEAERAYRFGGRNFFDAKPTLTALALADHCYATLRDHAVAALEAVEQHRSCPALEATVEACILMSGIAWESGGVSLAHAIVRGIARLPGAEASLHGEHVAYGLLVQLAIEGASEDLIAGLLRFYHSVSLPSCLHSLGATIDVEEAANLIGRWAHDGPSGGNLIVSASEEAIAAAVVHVERFATR